MSEAWTCPVCGTTWSADTSQCFHCQPAPEVPGAAEPAPLLPEPVPTGLPYPPPPEPLPHRDSRRPFGALLTAPFGVFADHFSWLASVMLVVVLPAAVALGWLIQAWFDHERSRYSRLLREVFHQTPPDPGWGDTLLPAFAFAVTISFLGGTFRLAALYSTLAGTAPVGRPSPGTALTNGVNHWLTCLGTEIWLFLRLLPWYLLFIVPGIVKSVAWSFALPARLAGDASNPEEAILISEAATQGRRGYLFGYFVVMALIGGGIDQLLTPIGAVLAQTSGMGGLIVFSGIWLAVQTLWGMISSLGLWLAYADAMAALRPESRAAAWAAPRRS